MMVQGQAFHNPTLHVNVHITPKINAEYPNGIVGAMVSVHASSGIDREFEPR
jgi:hypothetical protein